MKKLLILILATVYITTTSGIVLNVHYCMGKISSIEIDNFGKANCKCSKPGSSLMSCCFSKYQVVKLGEAHKAVLSAPFIQTPVANLPSALSLIDAYKTSYSALEKPTPHSPPLPSTDLCIKNCVFRL